jgi:hypothetical protein
MTIEENKQTVLNQMRKSDYDKLSDIAYENDYAAQYIH